jgi:hypothetical protein
MLGSARPYRQSHGLATKRPGAAADIAVDGSGIARQVAPGPEIVEQ